LQTSNSNFMPKGFLCQHTVASGMKDKRGTLYIPVVLVLVLSIPLVWTTLYPDFDTAKRLARELEGSDSFFWGVSDDKSTAIPITDDVIDVIVPDTKENVTFTNSTGDQQQVVQSTPKGSLLKGIANASVMVGIAVVSAFGLLFLFKRRKKLTLKMIFSFAIWLCSSLAIFLYIYMFRAFLLEVTGLDLLLPADGWPFYISAAVLGFASGTMITYNMVFRSLDPRRKNPALLAFSVFLGPFLAVVLDTSLVLFLLIGVALWDLWAAKRGVIKEIVTMSDEHRKEVRRQAPSPIGIVPTEQVDRKKRLISLKVDKGEDLTTYGLYEGKHYSLGIGDFIFFSLLSSTAFTWFMLKMPWMGFYVPGWGELVAVLLTVLVVSTILLGLKQTLSFLEKDSIMPGLPLSVLWGLIAFLTSAIVLEILNLALFGGIVNPF